MTRHAVVRGAIIALLGSAACESNESAGNCSEICTQLQQCNLLPSPLGRTIDDCKRRCRRSDQSQNFGSEGSHDRESSTGGLADGSVPLQPTPYSQIQQCYERSGFDQSESSTSDAGACARSCGSFAVCLENEFPSQGGVVGTGDVSIVMKPQMPQRDVPSTDGGADSKPISDCQATDSLSMPANCDLISDAANPECTVVQTRCSELTSAIFLEFEDRSLRSTYSSGPLSCRDFFLKPHVFTRLPAGTLTMKVRLQRIEASAMKSSIPKKETAPDAGELSMSIIVNPEDAVCETIATYRVLVRAGVKVNRAISLDVAAYGRAQVEPDDTTMLEPCVKEQFVSAHTRTADAGLK